MRAHLPDQQAIDLGWNLCDVNGNRGGWPWGEHAQPLPGIIVVHDPTQDGTDNDHDNDSNKKFWHSLLTTTTTDATTTTDLTTGTATKASTDASCVGWGQLHSHHAHSFIHLS